MEAETYLWHLRDGLRDAVRRSKLTAGEASEALGRHRGHVGRMTRGKAPLRVEEVFALLDVLEIDPPDFFTLYFPLGGEVESRLHLTHPREVRPSGGITLKELRVSARQSQGKPRLSSVGAPLRCGQILNLKLRQRRISQRQVEEELGLGTNALGRALRGETELTFERIFAVLEVIGLRPGRFFVELLGPDPEDLLDELRWVWALDRAEAYLPGDAVTLADQRPERGLFPPRGDEEPREEKEEDSEEEPPPTS